MRTETPDDVAAIRDVNLRAFGGPVEASLVDALRRDQLVTLSLVAEEHGVVVGHILFSRVVIQTGREAVAAVALAPLAVVPERQRRGLGSMLVRAGLEQCRIGGERIVLVVGHPDYYPRFGFSHPLTRNLRSPYEGSAFMAVELVPGALEGVHGEVRYPPPFDVVS